LYFDVLAVVGYFQTISVWVGLNREWAGGWYYIDFFLIFLTSNDDFLIKT